MTEYRISGVWKDPSGGTITHYAFHSKAASGNYTRAEKVSKANAILLVEQNNLTKTWVWDYNLSFWRDGEKVEVVNGRDGKYLRSNPDNKLTDNLAHLINMDWYAS